MKDTDTTLSLAFLGGSILSAVGRAHFSALNLDRRWHLASGCFSQNTEVNSKTAREWGVDERRVYQNLDDLISNEKGRVAAVSVLTPTPDHPARLSAIEEHQRLLEGFDHDLELLSSSERDLELAYDHP